MDSSPNKGQEERERYEALEQLEDWLETPVMILGVIWLALLVVEFIWGLSPFLNILVYVIWGVFIVDFALRLLLAPKKIEFLKSNWLTALSLFIPALRIGRLARVLRLARMARATQSVRLVSMIGSLNRGMRILRNTMRRRGFGYVMLLTLIVTLVGAAGIYSFENPTALGQQAQLENQQGLRTYGEALWWTAMIMTTMGSQYWPLSPEGRLLALLLSIYAFAIFGYVTATLATFFLGSDRENPASGGEEAALAFVNEGQPSAASIEALTAEIAGLRAEVQSLRADVTDNKKTP